MKSRATALLGVLSLALLHVLVQSTSEPDTQVGPAGYGQGLGELKGSYGRRYYGQRDNSERMTGEYDEPNEGRRDKYHSPRDYHYEGRGHRDDDADLRGWNGENYLLAPPTSCAGKLPPACQNFDSAYPPQCNTRSYSLSEQGTTEGYYGGDDGDDYKGGDKPYKKQTLQIFAPVCASPGASYAWARQCIVTAQTGSTCTGVAYCQPGGARTPALATCTATGWTVTNGCTPIRCATAPVPPANSNIAAFAGCQVPGALDQVCPVATASCTGALTAVGVSATCRASGWDVQGCCQPADFNAGTLYKPGSIDTQQGWTAPDSNTGPWDQTIKAVSGRKVWQLSNAIASGEFNNQPTSYVSCQVAGEPGSNLWNNYLLNPPGPTAFAANNKFYWRVQFKSATGHTQIGLEVNLLSVAKQSTWQQAKLLIKDNNVNGFDLVVEEATTMNGVTTNPPFTIATGLSYTDVHTLETEITFVPGVNINGNTVTGNDIVKVYLDGNLIYTGSTWEAFYYADTTPNAGGIPPPRLQAVNALMFRVSMAAAGTTGSGLLFQEVLVGNSRV